MNFVALFLAFRRHAILRNSLLLGCFSQKVLLKRENCLVHNTECKLKKFTDTQIFREINFGKCRFKDCHKNNLNLIFFEALNFQILGIV